jgi:hypothetical protein
MTMRKVALLAFAGALVFGSFEGAGAVGSSTGGAPSMTAQRVKEILLAQRRSCQTASTCEEAVQMWCGGYSRADGDSDGIPCENVCRSLSQVEAIKKRIGC